MVDDGAPTFTTLAALRTAYDQFAQTQSTSNESAAPLGLRANVHGQFVRKRKLSKGLIFGDIALADHELLEVMVRARGGILTVEQVRQFNWDLHLGDIVTIGGIVTLKSGGHLIFHLAEVVSIDALWSDTHPTEFFDHTQFGGIETHEPGLFTNPQPADFIAAIAEPPRETSDTSAMVVATTRTPTAHRGSVSLAPNSQAVKPQKYTNIVQLHGFNACKFYFAGGANGTQCLRGEQCHFWHGDAQDYDANRQLWLDKRKEQRRAVGRIDGDHHDADEKHLKDHRARVLCDWLVDTMGADQLARGTGVVDVAGGKGEIPIQLWNLRGIPTTLIDPRPMKLTKRNRKIVQARTEGRGQCAQLECYLNDETWRDHAELFANCSLLVGMHPDDATEIIVDIALQHEKPFAIVPCCVMSRLFPNRQCRDGNAVDSYDVFVRYLMEKDARIQNTFLSFEGKNQVLYLFEYGKN